MNELVRTHHAELHVLPSHQSLHSLDFIGRGDNFRLVVQYQLIVLNRLAQVRQQAQPLGTVLVPLQFINIEAALVVLGGIHRDFGALHQGLDVLAVTRRDDDAGLACTSRVMRSTWNDASKAR